MRPSKQLLISFTASNRAPSSISIFSLSLSCGCLLLFLLCCYLLADLLDLFDLGLTYDYVRGENLFFPIGDFGITNLLTLLISSPSSIFILVISGVILVGVDFFSLFGVYTEFLK